MSYFDNVTHEPQCPMNQLFGEECTCPPGSEARPYGVSRNQAVRRLITCMWCAKAFPKHEIDAHEEGCRS